MTFPTTKYEFEQVSYGTTNLNGILDTNSEKMDDIVHTRLSGDAGEDIDAHEAVYVAADGDFELAQADGSKQPCIGLAVESAANGNPIRAQRVGPIINEAWTWTIGAMIYLSASTPGALTETPSGVYDQMIGVALTTTSIYLFGGVSGSADMGGVFSELTVGGLGVKCGNETVTDGGTVALASGAAGFGNVMAGDNAHFARFLFDASGNVSLLSDTYDTDSADNPGAFCIYNNAGTVTLKNNTGASLAVKYEIRH